MLTVKEGLNMTADVRLVVTGVPLGSVLEGILEISLFVSPSGASKYTSKNHSSLGNVLLNIACR